MSTKPSNPWLGTLQRSYHQIKTKLLTELRNIKVPGTDDPLITDITEGNILVLILSMFAGVAEMLHYYVDLMARETFFSTARRYDSLVKHGKLVDYPLKLATAAVCDLVFIRSLTSTSETVTIKKDTQFSDTNGNSWITLYEIELAKGLSQIKVPIKQVIPEVSISGTVVENTEGQRYIPLSTPSQGYYENQSSYGVILMDGSNESVSYTEVETFAYSSSSDKHYKIITDETGGIYMVFGDGVNGYKPDTGFTMNGYINLTMGSQGNIASAAITGTLNDGAVSYSNLQAGGGSDYESFNTLKKRIPLSVKTLGVAVTKQDYIDLAMQYEGVAQADIEYVCGQHLNIYINPVEGYSNSGLAQQVEDFLKTRAPMNTWLKVFECGKRDIILDMDVTGKPSYTAREIENAIIQALSDAYPGNGLMGSSVRLSDIYALVDNLESVDYLHINSLYMMPWPTIMYGSIRLVVNDYIINKATGTTKYLVEIINSSTYRIIPYNNVTVYQDSSNPTYQEFIGNIGGDSININYPEDFDFDIALGLDDISIDCTGFKYILQVTQVESDYTVSTFEVPVFNSQELTLNITETV